MQICNTQLHLYLKLTPLIKIVFFKKVLYVFVKEIIIVYSQHVLSFSKL